MQCILVPFPKNRMRADFITQLRSIVLYVYLLYTRYKIIANTGICVQKEHNSKHIYSSLKGKKHKISNDITELNYINRNTKKTMICNQILYLDQQWYTK